MPRELTVTTTQLSGYLGISTRQIRKLAEEKVLDRCRDQNGAEKLSRFPLRWSVRGYIAHVQGRGRESSAEEDRYLSARAARMQALAERANLETALFPHGSDLPASTNPKQLSSEKSASLANRNCSRNNHSARAQQIAVCT
jgi:hypothetical protein